MNTEFAHLDDAEVAARYAMPRGRLPDGRAPIELCMVSSLDGSISLDGLSGGLSSSADRLVLSTLRAHSGCVLVAAGTVRSEGYGTPSRPDLTVAVVTNSCRLDWNSPLFTSSQAIVITHEAAELPSNIRAIRAGITSVDIKLAIDQLQEFVPRDGFIQLEGGPMLNATLHEHDLVDVVNLTLSPQLVGGTGQRMIESSVELTRKFNIEHALSDGDCLFTRWTRRSEAAS
ncbi:MAG: dihydrofolate reductase family protein [Ilumatobacteraceae bacterium]